MTGIVEAVQVVIIISVPSHLVTCSGVPRQAGYVTVVLGFCVVITTKGLVIVYSVIKQILAIHCARQGWFHSTWYTINIREPTPHVVFVIYFLQGVAGCFQSAHVFGNQCTQSIIYILGNQLLRTTISFLGMLYQSLLFIVSVVIDDGYDASLYHAAITFVFGDGFGR